jgi:PAS domain S-box-containing protein
MYEKLRKKAEELLGKNPEDTPTLSTADVQKLFHELDVHQIELQMQNEELLKSQAELTRSRDVYAELYDFAPVGYLIVDSDSRITDANFTAATLLGAERGKLTGKTFAGFVHHDSLKAWDRHHRHVVEQLEKHSSELLLQRGDDGGTFTAHVKCAPRPDGRYLMTLTDITPRVQAEAQVTEAAARWQTTFDAMADAVFILDTNQHIQFANKTASSLFDCPAEGMQGRPCWEIIHGGMDARGPIHQCPVQRMLKSGRRESMELPFDGSVYQITADPLLDKNGNLCGAVHIARDITARKQAEKTLAHQRELLQQVFDNIPILLLMWDPHLSRFVINRHTEKVLGWSLVDVQSGDLMALLYPDPDCRAKAAAGMNSFEPGWRERIATARSGERIPIEWANIRLSDGTAVSIGVDLRKRKAAEEALRKSEQELAFLNLALEQRIEERTAELQDSEKRFRILFNESPDACFLIDREGRFIDGNKAVEWMTGYPVAELVGQSVFDSPIFPPGARQTAEARIRQLEQEQANRLEPIEYTLQHKNGSELVVEVSTMPIRLQGQTVYLSSARDLTQRKQDEQTLRQSEERFRAIFENAGDGIVLTDTETKKIHAVNQAVCEMLNYSEQQLLNMEVEDMLTAEDLPHVMSTFEKQASGELPLAEDIPLQRGDGKIIYTDIKAFPIHLGGKRYLAGIFRDVTKRKEAEQQIQFEKNLFQSFMETLPAAVYFKDLDSRFIRTNQRTAQAFGLEKNETLIGKSDVDFYPAGAAKKKRRDELQVMQTRRPIQIEEQNGSRWFLTTKAPRYDQSGELAGTFGISFDITDKIRAQQDLEHSQRLLRSVFDTLHERVWWKDLHSVFLGCNLNVAHDAGLEHPDQLIGKTDYDMCWKEQAEHFIADDRDVMESGKPKLGILECQTQPDGTTRWIETNKIPLYDNDGKIIGTVGTYADITERRQAEAERERLGHQRQLALDAAQLGWWNFDPRTGVATYDRRLAEIFGVQGNKRPAEDFFALTHPDDQDSVREAIEAAMDPRDPQPYGIEYRITPPDGSLRWIEALGIAEFEGSGETRHATGLSGAVADITERKQMQKALGESEEKYRRLFESESDAILIIDGETRQVLDINKAAEELYGYSCREFLQLKQCDISAEPQASDAAIRNTLANSMSFIPHRMHRKKDGTVFPVEIADSSFLWKGRQVLCGVIRDITLRTANEQEILHNREELRHLASELVLAEQRERERIAAELHDEVSQLLSSTCLRLGMLQQTALPGPAVAEIKTIHEIIQRTLHETRTLTFDLSCPMLNELGLAASLEELCASMTHEQSIRFEFTGDTQPLPLQLDRQIVLYRSARELLINVMKHSAATWARVELQRPGGQVRICVADDGKGFDASMAGKGFSPSGGFGLFNIREYLQHAGGSLLVESVPGDGTQVVMTLPLEEEHD